MKQVFFVAMAALLAASFQSCDKTRITTLEGRVIDGHTGKPVAGIRIYMNAVGKKSEAYQTETSDANGMVSYSITTEGRTGKANLSTENAFFYGYFDDYDLDKSVPVKYGEENNLDIPLEPKDAWLRMHVKNETNQAGKVFGKVAGIGYSEYFTTNPLSISLGDSMILLMRVGSDRDIKIYLYSSANGPIPSIPAGLKLAWS